MGQKWHPHRMCHAQEQAYYVIHDSVVRQWISRSVCLCGFSLCFFVVSPFRSCCFIHFPSVHACPLSAGSVRTAVCHAKHKFKKNHAKIIQKAIIFQSPTQQAYPITKEILYYEKDRETVLFAISLLKSLTQTIANPQK